MQTTELIPVNDISQELTLETLPPLMPQQRLMLNYILDGNDYTTAYRKAGYQSKDHADKAAHVLVTRNPLKAHLEYFSKELSKLITPEYIATKLNKIADNSINKDEPQFYNPEIAIKAYDQVNKIRGYYASTNVNVNTINASIEDLRNARNEYKKEQ